MPRCGLGCAGGTAPSVSRATSPSRTPPSGTVSRATSPSRRPYGIQGDVALEEFAKAKSDLVNVLSSLEAHWHVLEAEVVEINRDIDYCEQCLRKYGEWFNSPLQYLRVRATAHSRYPCLALQKLRAEPLARRPAPPRR